MCFGEPKRCQVRFKAAAAASHHGRTVSPCCSEDGGTGGFWVHRGCWMSGSTLAAPSCMHGLSGTFPKEAFALHVIVCVIHQPGLSVSVRRYHGLCFSAGCINLISEWIAIQRYFLATKGTDKLYLSILWNDKKKCILEEVFPTEVFCFPHCAVEINNTLCLSMGNSWALTLLPDLNEKKKKTNSSNNIKKQLQTASPPQTTKKVVGLFVFLTYLKKFQPKPQNTKVIYFGRCTNSPFGNENVKWLNDLVLKW